LEREATRPSIGDTIGPMAEMRRFGRRQGVRRYQRYGQTALDLGRTLDPRFSLGSQEREDSQPGTAGHATNAPHASGASQGAES
jgi:hypothetical protein